MSDADRLLVLVRHGQSAWNLTNLFTGWRDVGFAALWARGQKPGLFSMADVLGLEDM